MIGKMQNLPSSTDEYWEGAEINHFTPVSITICPIHTRGTYKGEYRDNGDGTVSCIYCPYGFKLGSKMRIVENKVIAY